MKPNRRQVFTAGAAVAASTVAASTDAGNGRDARRPVRLRHARLLGERDPGHLDRDADQRVVETNGVYMFGDSISVQDGKSLAIRLLNRDGSQMAVNNWSSRPTSGAVDALQQWASTYGLPRRILMASGSNDIFDPPKFAAQVDRAISIVGQNRTLFWVDLQVVRTAQTAAVQLADQRNSSWLNMQLYDAQKKYPNLRIIRWAEWLWVKPYRLANYLRDGVHPSVPLGQDARNELIVQSLTQR